MIAKQVRSPSAVKSEFVRLTKYLIHDQGKLQRVGEIRVTNCHSDDVAAAMLEVMNTQAQNSRAGPDRTYHLLISFRPGEEVDRATLALIEDRVCAAIGFAEHQRVSVVHHDTDNLHVHIAINKIHPVRYTIYEPYRDYRTLAQVCEAIEEKYGLERDNHEAQKVGAENRAADMETQAGVESLLGWIKRECIEQIRGAKSWGELHQALSDHGLELRKRANGLVFADSSGITVRASAVDRGFSQMKLEARLGAFEAATVSGIPRAPSKTYEKKPFNRGINTAELYAKYKSEQANNSRARAVALLKARDRKNELIARAKRHGRLKRTVIKLMNSPPIGKKLMHVITSATLVSRISAIHQAYLKERKAICDQQRRRAWADWLRVQASAGDKAALQALRARGIGHATTGNTFCGNSNRSTSAARPDGMSKKGTVIYSCGMTAVRDDGDRLAVSRGADLEGLSAALQMARERYGARIAVRGSDAFREQVAFAAAAGKLDITFDDKALELTRRALVRSSNSPARAQGQSERDASPVDCGRDAPPRRSVASPQIQPLDINGAKRPDEVMRTSATEATLGALAAAKYVHDREQKRARIFDISKHSLYTLNDGSAMTYGGMRHVDGQALVLLRHDGGVKVVPVDEASARRLKKLKIGTPLIVTADGIVKTKGRSR